MRVFTFSFCLIFFFLVLLQLDGQAQWYQPDNISKKARKKYDEARTLYSQGDYSTAMEDINSAIKIEPKFIEALALRANIFADSKNYTSSISDFEKAITLDSVFSNKYLSNYSNTLAGLGNFEKALETINLYLKNNQLGAKSIEFAKDKKKCFQFAVDYKKNHPSNSFDIEISDLGPGINTDDMEYYPSITIDGKKMVFTRRKNNNEDFWESDFVNNKWQEATLVKGNLNTRFNEGAQCLSQDGDWLIFTACNYLSGYGSCDLYISFKNKDGIWGNAENIGPLVNTEKWEISPSLSSDKNDLYFSSNRGSGYGGNDIWVTHRIGEKKWSYPENLGPTINSEKDESYPFIHADNQTLYFSSDGHPGYGKKDLFVSRKQKDGSWGTPMNLGFPINTINDEGSLIVASDGQTAYFATEKTGRSNSDILSFHLSKEISANKTEWINGIVYDKKTNLGVPSIVVLTDVNNPILTNNVPTDEKGNFFITLPVGKEYSFNVFKKGYLFYSDHFSIQNNFSDSSIFIKVPLEPLEKGASIVLKNIFFNTNESILTESSSAELNQLIQLLQENPALHLEIAGHTDNTGRKEDNLLLSKQRSASVINYLISKGISKFRLEARGYGDTLPIADNSTPEGRSKNRRTEIKVISN